MSAVTAAPPVAPPMQAGSPTHVRPSRAFVAFVAFVARLRGEGGTVTAEFAAALPAAVLVLVLAMAALQASALQLRVVDAASVAARSLGRGEAAGDADARVGRLVGDHDLSTAADGDFVCATVSAPIVFGALGGAGIRVSANSCALSGGK